MAYCYKCGKPLDSGARYCWNCGADVSAYAHENNQQNTANQKGTENASGLKSVIHDLENMKIPDEVSDVLSSVGITSGTGNQKLEMVRNYPIPNTMEELYELASLAYNNINEHEFVVQPNGMKARLTDAWFRKLEQIYKKAQASFENDPKTYEIKDMYAEKAEAIAGKKRMQQQNMDKNMNAILKLAVIMGIGAAICIVLFYLLIFILPFILMNLL